MTTSIRRRGWESIVDGEDDRSASLTRSIPRPATDDILKSSKWRPPWCTLIATLQRARLNGVRMDFAGLGGPVGNGTYFAVWRHQIGSQERLAYVDQDTELLPEGSIVALKRVIPRNDRRTGEIDLWDKRQLSAVALEVRALCVAELRKHENIVTLIGLAWESRGSHATAWPTLILEYCDFNLSEYQQCSPQTLTPDEKLRIGQGIGMGISAIHSVLMVHGDIKSENVLIKIELGEAIPKLADFGCSLLDLELDENENVKETVWIGGTNPWRAPECMENGGWVSRKDAPATDLYSYGLLWWRLLHDDKDPFLVLLGGDKEVSDNGAKEEMKRTDDLAILARENISSLSSANSTLAFVPEMVCCLLQVNPSARLEALSNFEHRNIKLGFSFTSTRKSVADSIFATGSFHATRAKLSTSDPVINMQSLCRSEIMVEERRLSVATRRRVFQELLQIDEVSRSMYDVCPGCCSFTVFDEAPNRRPPALDVIHYLEAARAELDKHTCLSDPFHPNFEKPDSKDYRASLQLFTCFVEGYGVEPDQNEALACLVRGAERGKTSLQHDLASMFMALKRPLPVHLPLRKWMMSSVVHGTFGGASEILTKTDPELLRIAKSVRYRLYDGLSYMPSHVEPGLSPSEAEAGYTILHKAAGSWEEPLEYIQKLCTQSPWAMLRSILATSNPSSHDVNSVSFDGETPLLVACRAQRRNVIHLLLRLGANVFKASYSLEETPLHWVALMDDSKDLITELIARGANIHAQSKLSLTGLPWRLGGFISNLKLWRAEGTPLCWAIATANPEAAQTLVDHGADIDLAPSGALSPLRIAVYMARKDLVEILLSRKPSTYTIDSSVFSELVSDPTVTKRCLEQHSENDQVQVTKILSKFCPRSNLGETFEFFKFIIQSAIRGASFHLLESILHCLDVCFVCCGSYPGKPLAELCWAHDWLSQIAVKRNEAKILDLVLNNGANLGPETLHTLAIKGGSRDCIQVLLNHGAKLDLQNVKGPFTPFGFAVLYGNVETAKTLAELMTPAQLSEALSPDGTMELGDGKRFTLLGAIIRMIHVTNERTKGVEYLFSLPSHLNAVNFIVRPQVSLTALHLTLDEFDLNEGLFHEFSNLSLFRFLLSNFHEPHHVNARDCTGYTALHFAAWLAKLEECQLLVEAGTDLDVLADDRTPLDCCFLFPPGGMVKKEGGLGPTREMIRRYEDKRNACAQYLRGKGARSGLFEITKGETLPEFRVPFPARWQESRRRGDHDITTIV